MICAPYDATCESNSAQTLYKGKTVEYQVTIPASSSATLYLPGGRIQENGKSPEQNPLIGTKEQAKGMHRLELQSGSYQFSIR
jgi:hypothetical protein